MRLIHSIIYYDLCLFSWFLQRKHYAQLAAGSRWLSKTGDGVWYGFLAILVWHLDTQWGAAFVSAGFLGFLIERPGYFLLKNTLKRGRPETALPGFRSQIVPSDEFSFPSGHTSGAFLVATLCAYFYPLMVPWIFVWAGLVGLSRVFLGVHYPADVVMGALMGSSCALIGLWIVLP